MVNEKMESDANPRSEFTPQAGDEFVITESIEDLTVRAVSYLKIGYAVHLSGPAGTGKTTLAMHIASRLSQPCMLLHGDDDYSASDLVGKDTGYKRNTTVDNYVSSIVKTEETLAVVWSSNRLTTACEKGHTLIYDEFTRSPATANNPLLSVLEEGILNIPSSGSKQGYIKVHPNFRVIFTSNPEEYVGVHKTQDALMDRMITIPLSYQDRETEAEIIRAKSRRSKKDSEAIVEIVRAFRDRLGGKNGPTIRSAVAIARILDERGGSVSPDDRVFVTTCKDVLYYDLSRSGASFGEEEFESVIRNPNQEVFLADSRVPVVKTEQARGPRASSDNDLATVPTEPPTETPSEAATPSLDGPPSVGAVASVEGPPTERTESIEPLERSPEERVLETVADLALQTHDDATGGEESHRDETLLESDKATKLPRPPQGSRRSRSGNDTADDEPLSVGTASPEQMLESAVSRFLRPPSPGSFQPSSPTFGSHE